MTSKSNARKFLEELVDVCGAESTAALETMIAECTPLELAELWFDWPFWARPEQLPPQSFWSWGFLAGRGFGKTRPCAEYVNREVRAGRARRVALIAQHEDKTVSVLIKGESGLIETSPPWFRPRFVDGVLRWPNGAEGFVYSAESPEALRGPAHDLGWMSEIGAWARAKREHALYNFRFSVRLGLAQIVWDTTKKPGHPLIRRLVDRAARDPIHHVLVTGTTSDNEDNLAESAISEWRDEYAGTAVGAQEMSEGDGEESSGALFQVEWIDKAKCQRPLKLDRKNIAIDPAVSTRRSTDDTGIVLSGAVDDGQRSEYYVLRDLSAKMPWEVWGELVVRLYVDEQCDCIVVERNRGGDACVANIRACAREYDRAVNWRVQVVDVKRRCRHVRGVIYVKEVFSHTSKEVRAEACVGLYKQGLVHHVNDCDLEELESQLTGWVAELGATSPNNMDALVHGLWELAGLWDSHNVNPARALQTATQLQSQIAQSKPDLAGIVGLLGRVGTVRTI